MQAWPQGAAATRYQTFQRGEELTSRGFAATRRRPLLALMKAAMRGTISARKRDPLKTP
jgi:hypothetical protein